MSLSKQQKLGSLTIYVLFGFVFFFSRVQSLDVPVEKVNVIHFFVTMCQCLTMTTWRLVTSQECLWKVDSHMMIKGVSFWRYALVWNSHLVRDSSIESQVWPPWSHPCTHFELLDMIIVLFPLINTPMVCCSIVWCAGWLHGVWMQF